MTTAGIAIDTSALINFLVIDRARLLGGHPSVFFVTSQVEGEVLYYDHRRRLSVAFREGHLARHPTEGLRGSSPLFSELTEDVGLGEGESSAIAVAAERKWAVATDDGDAIRYVKQRSLNLPIITTWGLFREFVTAGVLTEREARDLYAESGMK